MILKMAHNLLADSQKACLFFPQMSNVREQQKTGGEDTKKVYIEPIGRKFSLKIICLGSLGCSDISGKH